MLLVLKWICFLIVCLDSISYVLEFGEGKHGKGFSVVIGLVFGVIARVIVLYGTVTTWLLN